MSKTLVKRAYKYRFYPTEEQATVLSRTFGCVRKVYNLALEVRTRAWSTGHRRVNYADSAFFDKRAGYPRFKSRKKSNASAEYTRSAFRWRDGQLTLAKMREPLRIVWSRPLPVGAEPSTVTVSCDAAGRWFLSALVETTVDHHPPAGDVVGVDAGITSLLTLSTGEKKVTSRLVRENQTIVIEDLNVRGMVRNRSLARAISDASWSQFRALLEYKAAWYGREVNAARNILAAGLAAATCGGGVRPTRR